VWQKKARTGRPGDLPAWVFGHADGPVVSIPFLHAPPRVPPILIDLCPSPTHSFTNMGAEYLLRPADYLLMFAGRLNLWELCFRGGPSLRGATAQKNRGHEPHGMQTFTLPGTGNGPGSVCRNTPTGPVLQALQGRRG